MPDRWQPAPRRPFIGGCKWASRMTGAGYPPAPSLHGLDLRKASLMRLCQPLPVARNFAITSVSSRSDNNFLLPSRCGFVASLTGVWPIKSGNAFASNAAFSRFSLGVSARLVSGADLVLIIIHLFVATRARLARITSDCSYNPFQFPVEISK